ncbi:MAG TPA: leucyl aminopeptidase [Candidatus Babeliales bacterium]|nr:leucyl aminopeptidase [Candidatus Babeliales bacterium]
MAITIKAFEIALHELDGAARVFCVEQNFTITPALQALADKYFPNLPALIEKQKFTGKAGSTLTAESSVDGLSDVILLGLGKKKDGKLDIEACRRALGALIRIVQGKKIKTVALQLPSAENFGVDAAFFAEQVSSIISMATYQFDTYLTEESRILEKDITVNLSVKEDNLDAMQKGLARGLVIAESVNMARQWVDLPPNALTPADLADEAEHIAKKHNFEYEIFDHAKVKSLGMGGLIAVSQGSKQECRFVIIKHTVSESAPTLGFVGKGITFDSGGLSLKPPQSMETMKEDMSGAAAVIATMNALGEYKPNVNIVMVAPMAENLPSGEATKPGDIIRFYNGKTAEVKNTDAEGRLILADALSYITKNYKIDAIYDLATLTGACAYALGPFFSGLFSEHEDLVVRTKDAGNRSGDAVWRLPLTDDYKPAIKSEVADLCNIGKKSVMAGGTTAAAFLQNFVGDTPWVHLDIAGTAFNVPGVPYFRPETATGVGVRILVELASNWEQKDKALTKK